jgi:hypothetical protein
MFALARLRPVPPALRLTSTEYIHTYIYKYIPVETYHRSSIYTMFALARLRPVPPALRLTSTQYIHTYIHIETYHRSSI